MPVETASSATSPPGTPLCVVSVEVVVDVVELLLLGEVAMAAFLGGRVLPLRRSQRAPV
ncbi:hypothetical protein GCM10010195_27020 [Kitasatospora griseola]|nr:hypothetical protein GCM10010195_27020 [Kitasatospora griseola]